MKLAKPTGDDFTLLCMECEVFACFSSDTHRIEESHHIVVAEDFKELLPCHQIVRLCPEDANDGRTCYNKRIEVAFVVS